MNVVHGLLVDELDHLGSSGILSTCQDQGDFQPALRFDLLQRSQDGQMVFVRPQLGWAKKKVLRNTVVLVQRIRHDWCCKLLDPDPRWNDLNSVLREPIEVVQQITFGVLAICLKIARVARAQIVGDSTTQEPQPAKKLWIMEVLNVVDCENRWFAAVEISQNGSGRIKYV